MELLLFQIALAASPVLFLLSKRYLFRTVLFFVLFAGGISTFWALRALGGHPLEGTLLLPLLGTFPRIVLDPLSAFFVLVINFTVLSGTLYARGYLQSYYDTKSAPELRLHYFSFLVLHFSMLLVCMLREALPFLLAWELMSLSSFFLVIFEGRKKEVLKIGISYLIQMHLGFLCIMSAFLIAWTRTGISPSFEGLATYFASFPEFPLFLLFFVGFGIKAGFIPLHSWLPHAHPAAPSHVSGIMSGVMIKMGIYGILRVLLYMHKDLLETGTFLLGISMVSGLLGVMYAMVQHDMKKLLAYHSIENIGIIGMGIGGGLLGIATGNETFAFLALTGGLLHVLNHSLFKSLLFFTSGSAYLQTHTRNLEHLGGLLKKMPSTGMLFLFGAAAICGLPPLNGFVSEFCVYSGFFQALRGGSFSMDIAALLGILALSLIGGLAIFCFAKAFGVAFLGSPRSSSAARAKEVPLSMNLPLYGIALLMGLIGLLPLPFLKMSGAAAELFFSPGTDFSFLYAKGTFLSPVGAFFLLLVLILLGLRKLQQSRVAVEESPTWGCGYSWGDPARHQYTATSFAGSYVDLIKPLIPVKTAFESLREEEIFPGPRSFSTSSRDFFEDLLVRHPSKKLLSWMEKAALFQSGKVQHYILYAFAFLTVMLILLFTGVL